MVVLLFVKFVKLFGILLLLLFLLLIYCIVWRFSIKFFFVCFSSELFGLIVYLFGLKLVLVLFKIFIVKLNGWILKMFDEFVSVVLLVIVFDSESLFVFGYCNVNFVCELVLNCRENVCGDSLIW